MYQTINSCLKTSHNASKMDNNIIPQNCCGCCRDRHRDVSMNSLSSYSWRINCSWWSSGSHFQSSVIKQHDLLYNSELMIILITSTTITKSSW